MPFARENIEHKRFSLKQFSLNLASVCHIRHNWPPYSGKDTLGDAILSGLVDIEAPASKLSPPLSTENCLGADADVISICNGYVQLTLVPTLAIACSLLRVLHVDIELSANFLVWCGALSKQKHQRIKKTTNPIFAGLQACRSDYSIVECLLNWQMCLNLSAQQHRGHLFLLHAFNQPEHARLLEIS